MKAEKEGEGKGKGGIYSKPVFRIVVGERFTYFHPSPSFSPLLLFEYYCCLWTMSIACHSYQHSFTTVHS